ncbi:CKS1 (YBR135W) [Zygosaccharomyces parabailii]|nr:CKS1 (YBR135W) [Zygosaccharomyces parabailii]CDH08651.1 probable Cyclin-dependent kinases regulatory subunit [Zygosaccharomyces bailii ISA1307]
MYHHHHTFQGRKLTDQERARVLEFQDSIHYSPRYSDDTHEYRHVMLPKAMLKVIPSDYFNSETGTLRILTEDEWRGLGVTQSLGWEHYECHAPEPHILLFKRPLNYEAELRAAAAAVAAAQQQQQQQQQNLQADAQVRIP